MGEVEKGHSPSFAEMSMSKDTQPTARLGGQGWPQQHIWHIWDSKLYHQNKTQKGILVSLNDSSLYWRGLGTLTKLHLKLSSF